MTEKAIAEGIQTTLQSMSDFSAGDVAIEEWTILDGSTQNAPYVIIEVSDDFVARQEAPSEGTVWQIPANLYTRFIDWPTSKTAFRDTRQAIIDKFNEASDNRSAGIAGNFIRQQIAMRYPFENHQGFPLENTKPAARNNRIFCAIGRVGKEAFAIAEECEVVVSQPAQKSLRFIQLF